MKVTKESIIGDVLDFDVDTAQFFFAIGMHCLGCPAARGETIEQACAVHGTDADELVVKSGLADISDWSKLSPELKDQLKNRVGFATVATVTLVVPASVVVCS